MFTGSLVALITPFNSRQEVDYVSLEKLINMHIMAKTSAIVVAGTTGESATLASNEHIKLISKVIEIANGSIDIIGGCGSNSTNEAIELTLAVQKTGAKAGLLISPYYNKPTQEGIYRHYQTIADNVQLPLLLYNVPSRTASDMLPETVAKLAEHDNIVGIKEAVGDMSRIKQLLSINKQDFVILSGDDATTLDAIFLGAKGVISVTANVVPKLMQEMCMAALESSVEKAKSINNKLQKLHEYLFIESNPIPVKWLLHKLQLCEDILRLPLTSLSEKYQSKLMEALKHAQIDI